MLKETKDILRRLIHRKIIGGKHTPERQALRPILFAQKHIRKEFEKEYKILVNATIILRFKKRTGKDYDWHISINPKSIPLVKEMIENDA